MKSLATLLALTLLLAACGSKGPLTLPEQKPGQDSASTQKTSK